MAMISIFPVQLLIICLCLKSPDFDSTYILLNGLTYNLAEYFTSFELIFPSPERGSNTVIVTQLFFRAMKGRGKMRETSKMLAWPDYMLIKPFNRIFII